MRNAMSISNVEYAVLKQKAETHHWKANQNANQAEDEASCANEEVESHSRKTKKEGA